MPEINLQNYQYKPSKLRNLNKYKGVIHTNQERRMPNHAGLIKVASQERVNATSEESHMQRQLNLIKMKNSKIGQGVISKAPEFTQQPGLMPRGASLNKNVSLANIRINSNTSTNEGSLPPRRDRHEASPIEHH